MEKAKTERVVLATFSSGELDGSLDSVIDQLTEYRAEAAKRGLTDVRLSTDWHDEPVYVYGGYDGTSETIWTTSVVADKVTSAVFKTKLPKKQHKMVFEIGRLAAERGWERKSPYNGGRGEVAWFEGFDSVGKEMS